MPPTSRPALPTWLLGLVALVVVAAGLATATRLGSDEPGTGGSAAGPRGAAVLGESPGDDEAGRATDVTGRVAPAPEAADDDVPDLYADGCQLEVEASEPRDCAYGVPADEARATVAVVGDSKAGQWVPALQVLAERHHWRIEVFTKSACPAVAAPVAQDGRVYETCTAFNEAVTRRLTDDPVDLVLTTSSRDSAVSGSKDDGSPELSKDAFVAGLQRTWSTWAATGSKVLVVSDTPKPADPDDAGQLFEVPECAAEHPDDLSECSFDRAAGVGLSGRDAQEAAVRAAGARDVTPVLEGHEVIGGSETSVSWLDLVPWVCPASRCSAVIGGTLVYRDGSHLTRTYVETLAPRIERALAAAGLA